MTVDMAFAIGALMAAPAVCQPREDGTARIAGTQPQVTATNYVAVSPRQRVFWIVDGTIGPRSLYLVGPLGALWQTAFNDPSEWGRRWSGVGRRYLQREADVAISNTIEAELGAIWGEDPRYIPSGRQGIRARLRYALKTAFVVQRRDGHLAPAWGRYAGNVLNNVIEDAWLPPSATTAGRTIARGGLGMLTRLGGNVWDEFWPDVRRRLKK